MLLKLCSRRNKIVGTNIGGQELFCVEAPDESEVNTLRNRIADALDRDFNDVQLYDTSGVLAADCPPDLSSLTVEVRQPEAVQLLDVFSPAELLEFCGAVESLHKRCKREQYLVGPLRILGRGSESVLAAQRGLDYFARTWEAFRTGNVNCPVCLEEIDAYVGNFLFCGHAICVACTERLRESRCPICRCEVPGLQSTSGALNRAKPKVVPPRQLSSKQVMEYRSHWSSKMCKMLETLQNIRASSPAAKVIVFSQWDSLRCHVSQALHDRSVKHLNLKGSIFDRSHTLERFRSDPSVSLLLLKNPVTPTNMAGMMMAVLGVFCYNRAKHRENVNQRTLPVSLPTKSTPSLWDNHITFESKVTVRPPSNYFMEEMRRNQ